MQSNLNAVLEKFQLVGECESVVPFKIGHINETYVSSWRGSGRSERYVHQRINHHVFQDVPGLMGNLSKILAHLRAKQCDPELEQVLTIVPTKTGQAFCQNGGGNFWRTYKYIENTRGYNVCPGASQAYEAGRVAGKFLHDLADFEVSQLCETIPLFHHVPNRFRLLDEAVQADAVRRAATAKPEIDFALARRPQASLVADALARSGIPLRATHNDLKLNNVLFSEKTGRALCVVDLDTCMPGCSLFDFGDLVRSASVSAAEDETDLESIHMNQEYFAALVRGYLDGTAGILTAAELDLLPVAPRLIALALGVRFLTDYLNGDNYFRVHHPLHNIERARAQFAIVQDMERREAEMRGCVEACVGRIH